MSFEEEFPSLQHLPAYALKNSGWFTKRELLDFCLDKQRVKETIEKIEAYTEVDLLLYKEELRLEDEE